MTNILDHVTSKKNTNNKTKKFIQEAQQRNQSNSRQQQARNNHGYVQDERRDYLRGFLEDGLDHINIWEKAETDLGRILSMEGDINVTIDPMGKFRSPLALWTYLTTKRPSDSLRNAFPHELRDWIRNREFSDNVQDYPNAMYLCACLVAKFVEDNPEVKQSLIDTGDVPLTSYYIAGRNRVPHAMAYVWTDVIRLIRAECIMGNELVKGTFEYLLDTDISYDEVFNIPLVEPKRKLGSIAKPAPVELEVKAPKVKKPKKAAKPDDGEATQGALRPMTPEERKENAKKERERQRKEFALTDTQVVYVFVLPDAEIRRQKVLDFLAIGLDPEKQQAFFNDIRDTYPVRGDDQSSEGVNFYITVEVEKEVQKTGFIVAVAEMDPRDNPFDNLEEAVIYVRPEEDFTRLLVQEFHMDTNRTFGSLNPKTINQYEEIEIVEEKQPDIGQGLLNPVISLVDLEGLKNSLRKSSDEIDPDRFSEPLQEDDVVEPELVDDSVVDGVEAEIPDPYGDDRLQA